MNKQVHVKKLLFKNPNLAEQCKKQDNEFRQIGKFCDWSLKTEDGSKFPVHKLVLASTSDFFRLLLDSDMIESSEDEEETDLTGITGENMKILLSYIYTGEIEITTENMKDLFIHTSFYGLIELETATTEFILQNITTDNCLELWEFGEQYMNAKVEKKSLVHVLKNANKLFETSQIQDIKWEKINKLMAACVETGIDVKFKYKLMENWMSKDFTIREKYFKNLLDQIDFSKFDQKFFVTVITKNEQFKQNRDFLLKLVDLHEVYFKMTEDKNVSTYKNGVLDSDDDEGSDADSDDNSDADNDNDSNNDSDNDSSDNSDNDSSDNSDNDIQIDDVD